jgi:hypothetical protein
MRAQGAVSSASGSPRHSYRAARDRGVRGGRGPLPLADAGAFGQAQEQVRVDVVRFEREPVAAGHGLDDLFGGVGSEGSA